MNRSALAPSELDTLSRLRMGEHLRWPEIANLLDQVDRQAMWRQDGAASFTGWVRALSNRSGMGVAILWRSLSAMRFYERIRKDFPELDLAPVTAIQKGVTPDHLELLSKLSRVMSRAELMTQLRAVLDGTVNRAGLRDIWRAYRPVLKGRTARGRGQAIPTANPEDPEQWRSLVEAHIYQTLAAAGPTWTGFRYPDVYRLALNVAPISSRGTERAVVFDAVCVVRGKKNGPVLIEGMKFATRGPHWAYKMLALRMYRLYCDFFWLVVPEILYDNEIGLVPRSIGVLVASSKGVTVLRNAQPEPSDDTKRGALLKGLLVKEYLDE